MDNQNQQAAQQPISPTIQSSLTTPPHKPSMLLMGIGAIILLVIGLIGGYLLKGMTTTIQPEEAKPIAKVSPMETEKISSSPIPTSFPSPSSVPQIPGWKMYINEKNGYSLQYPTEKLVRFQCPDEEFTLQEKFPSNENLEGKPLETCGRDSRFLIEGKTYAANYTLPDFSSNYAVTTEEMTLAGEKATLYTYTLTKPFEGQGGPEWFEEILIHRNDKTYEFYLGNDKFKSAFANIVTTLKFIN